MTVPYRRLGAAPCLWTSFSGSGASRYNSGFSTLQGYLDHRDTLLAFIDSCGRTTGGIDWLAHLPAGNAVGDPGPMPPSFHTLIDEPFRLEGLAAIVAGIKSRGGRCYVYGRFGQEFPFDLDRLEYLGEDTEGVFSPDLDASLLEAGLGPWWSMGFDGYWADGGGDNVTDARGVNTREVALRWNEVWGESRLWGIEAYAREVGVGFAEAYRGLAQTAPDEYAFDPGRAEFRAPLRSGERMGIQWEQSTTVWETHGPLAIEFAEYGYHFQLLLSENGDGPLMQALCRSYWQSAWVERVRVRPGVPLVEVQVYPPAEGFGTPTVDASGVTVEVDGEPAVVTPGAWHVRPDGMLVQTFTLDLVPTDPKGVLVAVPAAAYAGAEHGNVPAQRYAESAVAADDGRALRGGGGPVKVRPVRGRTRGPLRARMGSRVRA